MQQTPASSLSSASTTAQSPLSSNLFQCCKLSTSRHPSWIPLYSSAPRFWSCISSLIPQYTAAGLELCPASRFFTAQSTRRPEPLAIPKCPGILLESLQPLHPAPTLSESIQQHAILCFTSSCFTRHSMPPVILLPFHPFPASEPLPPPATVCVSPIRAFTPILQYPTQADSFAL